MSVRIAHPQIVLHDHNQSEPVPSATSKVVDFKASSPSSGSRMGALHPGAAKRACWLSTKPVRKLNTQADLARKVGLRSQLGRVSRMRKTVLPSRREANRNFLP